MTMNKTERLAYQRLQESCDREISRSQRLLDENVRLRRELEIVCDRFNLSDEQRDEIRREALK